MTRPTSVALGLSAAVAALSLTVANSPGVAAATTAQQQTADRITTTTTAELTGLRALPPTWARLVSYQHHGVGAHRPHTKTYTVRAGDSFWSIAKDKNVDWYNLAADNHMQMYSVLKTGRVLDLPAKGEKPHKPMPLSSGGAQGPAAGPSSSSSTAGAPVDTVSATSSTSAFEACVISRESGGNPQAMNPSGHWGLFQFSEATWIAYGGTAAEFGNASAAVQEQVFANAMARGGESNWAPYDGC